jgi:hypothetical protein
MIEMFSCLSAVSNPQPQSFLKADYAINNAGSRISGNDRDYCYNLT